MTELVTKYECSGGCCDVTVRLGPKPPRSGPKANRPWLIDLNGIERTADAWATELDCSSSRIRNRINLGQCVTSKRIFTKREGAREDDFHRGGNKVGLWKNGFVPILQSWLLRA